MQSCCQAAAVIKWASMPAERVSRDTASPRLRTLFSMKIASTQVNTGMEARMIWFSVSVIDTCAAWQSAQA